MSTPAGEKSSDKKQRERELILKKVREAETAIKTVVHSIAMNVEEKIAIENQIRNIANSAESMLGRVESNLREVNQKKLLLAYKQFLEKNLDYVNRRLKDLG